MVISIVYLEDVMCFAVVGFCCGDFNFALMCDSESVQFNRQFEKGYNV